jgi:hypothetical protein
MINSQTTGKVKSSETTAAARKVEIALITW